MVFGGRCRNRISFGRFDQVNFEDFARFVFAIRGLLGLDCNLAHNRLKCLKLPKKSKIGKFEFKLTT